MTDKKIKEKVFTSVEQVLKEYLPRSQGKDVGNVKSDLYDLGVLLAKTDMKNVKRVLEING